VTQQAVARRYASALADVSLSKGESAKVKEDLSGWARLFSENQQLVSVFKSPAISLENKKNLLNSLITKTGILKTTANFLKVMLDNQRLPQLEETYREYAQELDKRLGVVSAEITTAQPIPEDLQELLTKRLKSMLGTDVKPNFKVDEKLIGGIVTRVGSTIYDGSIRNQLDLARKRLAGES
jgi:F-type H+-transporting ATPase subunit delta